MRVWEKILHDAQEITERMKVDGGWLYRSCSEDCMSMAFVPDVDLTRYQSHLRDAYNQGFKEGQADLRAALKDPRFYHATPPEPASVRDVGPAAQAVIDREDAMKYRPEIEGWKS